MKTLFLTIMVIVGFLVCACGEITGNGPLLLELPPLPDHWAAALGNPAWRIEWYDDEGQKQVMIVQENTAVEISLPVGLAGVVCAFPFWPKKDIEPGIFKPAGAVYPFDVSGRNLVLDWRGGVDAFFFCELLSAYASAHTGVHAEDGRKPEAVPRLPFNFNWPRFRRLFDDGSLDADICRDPWLADWHGAAEKIIASGFDKRRLVPEARILMEIPVNPGPWIGTSPFAAPLVFEGNPSFPVRAVPDTWISAAGLLRCNTGTWIFREF